MPHKLLERQYRLQAQKRHEENLRQDFYRRTALYFERESAAAQKFNSWSTRVSESYSDRLEKLQRDENLKTRREKLRRLLAQENEQYEKELDEQKRMRRRSNDAISLEQLRQKLMEKRAEHSLYYPNACRRLRTYAFTPTETARKLESLDIASGYNSTRPVSSSSQRHIRFSTSPSMEKALYYDYKNNDYKDKTISNQHYANSPKTSRMSSDDECTNLRYAARGHQQSLAQTNLRGDDTSYRTASLQQQPAENVLFSEQQQHNNYIEEQQQHNNYIEEQQQRHNIYMEEQQQRHNNYVEEQQQNHSSDVDESKNKDNSVTSEENRSIEDYATDMNQEGHDSNYAHSENEERKTPTAFIRHTENDKTDSGNETEDMDRHRRGNLRQRDADVAGDADISVQMFRYLKHNDLKRKILDLAQREHSFEIRHNWADALRLREMRNELILLKNKNLFENEDLPIDEEARQSGLEAIKARQELKDKRMKMCNTILYSDEAKDLWNQWVREDDTIMKMEENAVREILLMELEREWEHLALQDKNRISQLFDKVMVRSDLQDEHKLAAVIRAANDGQKQYMNYLGE